VADLDLARMRRERFARLQEQLRGADVDGLLLLGTSTVQYATGADAPAADQSHVFHERPAALVLAGDDAPHLFTPYPEGAPAELDGARVHPPLDGESDAGVLDMAKRLGEVLPAGTARLATDDVTAPMHFGLADALGVELADASLVLGPARITKTAGELECIRRSQHINELAMLDVEPEVRPGLRQTDLSALFLRRIHELGATANAVDPIWQVMAPSIATGPFTVHGDVAFPLVTTERQLSEGDVLWVDTGIAYHGYASDFGRTWVVGSTPTDHQRDQFRRWRDVVAAVVDVIRPGATGADLTRAATEANGGTRPWLPHFYLAHGVGTDSAEMPLVGTDLGEAFDEQLVLAPGMVLVLEPVIWDDGRAGYRSEEIVAVTDSGWTQLSDHHYHPYD